MALFTAPATVLPLYSRSPVAPSLPRRVAVVLAQILVAAAYGVAATVLPPNLLVVLVLPVAVCVLFALWLMPDRGVFPLATIELGYRVFFVLLILWPSYVALVLPGLPWMTPTRLALFAVTLAFLYSVSTSSPLRHHLFAVARVSPWVWIPFLAWQAAMFYTVPFSHHLGRTAKALIDNQVSLTGVFFLGCLIFARRGAATATIRLLLILTVLLIGDAVVEWRLQYPPWAHSIPSFLKVDPILLDNILSSQARSTDGLYRVRGPFANSLMFAEYLSLCVPFILHWLMTGRSLLLRAAMAFLFLATLFANVVTQSRLGIVGTLVGLGTYLPLWAFRQWRADRTSLLGPTILFGAPVALLLLVGLVLSSHTLRARVLGNGAQQASNAARGEQFRMAIPKVAANPIGHGLRESGDALGFVSIGGVVTVDNFYITTVMDLGLVGLIVFPTMFLSGAVIGTRLYLTTADRETELAGPLASMCVVFFVSKLVLSEEDNHSLVLLLLAMLITLFARERKLFDPDNVFPLLR